MKLYSIVANVEGTGWIIKLENEVPEKTFASKDEAIIEAENMAMKNSPSKVEVMDGNNRVIHEKEF